MKKVSKKTVSKKRAAAKKPIRKVQALITVEVYEGPLGKRAVADAVKTAFHKYSTNSGLGTVLRSGNLKRVAVNTNV